MSSETVYLTADGKRALETEMHELLSVRRPGVIDRIHDAQADGDVDDSGSLEEAKDELAQIDARAREIENMLRHAEIIPEHANGNGDGTIHLGSHIVVRDAVRRRTDLDDRRLRRGELALRQDQQRIARRRRPDGQAERRERRGAGAGR